MRNENPELTSEREEWYDGQYGKQSLEDIDRQWLARVVGRIGWRGPMSDPQFEEGLATESAARAGSADLGGDAVTQEKVKFFLHKKQLSYETGLDFNSRLLDELAKESFYGPGITYPEQALQEGDEGYTGSILDEDW